MQNKLRFRDFFVRAENSNLILEDLQGGTFACSPGEAAVVRELVHTVWRMTSLPAMPSPVKHNGFVADISKGQVEIRREFDSPGNVGFRYPLQDSDFVIQGIDMGVAKVNDLTSLDPRPKGAGVYTPSDDGNLDIIEGKV